MSNKKGRIFLDFARKITRPLKLTGAFCFALGYSIKIAMTSYAELKFYEARHLILHIYPKSEVENRSNYLLSHTVASIVPSALEGLTSVFGMGTGVSPLVLSLRIYSYCQFVNRGNTQNVTRKNAKTIFEFQRSSASRQRNNGGLPRGSTISAMLAKPAN